MKIRNLLPVILIALLLMFSFTSETQAQVRVVRSSHENPVVSIAKSTLYGAATGVLLGLALTLVVNEDTGDVIKWSFVGGTFGGFLIGIYHVANRPQPSAALLQFDTKGLVKMNLPKPQVRINKNHSLDLKVPLMSVSL